jgi:hypothetical protein
MPKDLKCIQNLEIYCGASDESTSNIPFEMYLI